MSTCPMYLWGGELREGLSFVVLKDPAQFENETVYKIWDPMVTLVPTDFQTHRKLNSRLCCKNTVWKLILIHFLFLPYTVTPVDVGSRAQTIPCAFLLRLFEPVQETLRAPLKSLALTTLLCSQSPRTEAESEFTLKLMNTTAYLKFCKIII